MNIFISFFKKEYYDSILVSNYLIFMHIINWKIINYAHAT